MLIKLNLDNRLFQTDITYKVTVQLKYSFLLFLLRSFEIERNTYIYLLIYFALSHLSIIKANQ